MTHKSAIADLDVMDPDAVVANPYPCRIFNVGMNKTGTSSFANAMRRLGVGPVASERVVQRTGMIEMLIEHGNYEPALRFAGVYRVFEDRPWNVWDMYRRLDERYPGSRFVLTSRKPESWWRSVSRWITVTKPHIAELYQKHLKAASLSEKDMVGAYLRYNQEVCDYFKNREDFLVVNFEAGDAWEPLCNFLNLPVPDRRFPHSNRQTYDKDDAFLTLKRKLRRKLNPDHKKSESILDVDHCVKCQELLNHGHKRKIKNALIGMPSWTKLPFRWVQKRAFLYKHRHTDTGPRLAEIKKRHPALTIDDMAVVTCFFNPGGYRSRVDNYYRFRRAMDACGLPVLTVELAFGNDPHMLDKGADELIQLRAPHTMWQKERLLNIGIQKLLERGYRKIVWIDADVVFEDPVNWPWFVAAKLEESPICQVFRGVVIDREPGLDPVPGVSSIYYLKCIGSWLVQERRGPSFKRVFGVLNGYSGFGWAARAEVLEQAKLYDRSILGGGDKLIYYASCPLPERWQERITKQLTTNFHPCGKCGYKNEAPHFHADYFAWANVWSGLVRGNVGFADLNIRALYHGELQHRQYRLRRDILLRHGFNPSSDLIMDANGCWSWASEKPGLHHQVHGYFFERKEDW